MSRASPESAGTEARGREAPRTAEDLPLPGGDFQLFVQKLGFQALIGMGVVENPLTRSSEPNLPQARGVIDDLVMLVEKTRGNLTAEEETHLERVVGDLQRHYLELVRSSQPD